MVFFNFKPSQLVTVFAGVVLLFGAGVAVISLQQQQQTSSHAATSSSSSYIGVHCSAGGKSGTCQDKGITACTGGAYHSGFCPGPVNIQCCIKNGGGSGSGGGTGGGTGGGAGGGVGVGRPCMVGAQSGICQDSTVASSPCLGTYSPGNCTGTGIKCCVPPPTSAGDTTISLDLLLHGIGKAGDSVLPGPTGGGNMNPKTPLRQIAVNLLDAGGKLKASGSGYVTFQPTTGNFTGKINMGKQIATSAYIVKVKFTQSLWTAVPGFPTITAGKDNAMPQISLVTGDVNNDGAVSITIKDYNILLGCYSYFSPAPDCDATRKQEADLDDDGNVNQTDLNLFLRELSQRK